MSRPSFLANQKLPPYFRLWHKVLTEGVLISAAWNDAFAVLATLIKRSSSMTLHLG
jgi:hypothetical protein